MKYPSKIYSKMFYTHRFFRSLLIDRVEENKDNLVLVTARRGMGKSTFVIKEALGFKDIKKLEKEHNEVNSKIMEDYKYVELKDYTPFSMSRDIVYTKKELQELCMNHKKAIFIADEAVVSVSRRNSMTKTNKELHQVLTINRKNNNTIFLCLPAIEDLDVSILQYVSCWIHIHSRGLAVLMLPNKPSIFGRKTWEIDMLRKNHDKVKEENPKIDSVPYWIHSNFRGYIKFGKLGSAIEERYLELADEKKNLEIQEKKKEKVKPDRLGEDKRLILKNIAKDLVSGKITDSADYFKHCGSLEFKKERLNKEVNNVLSLMGEGRIYSRIIKENYDELKQKQYEENSEIKMR